MRLGTASHDVIVGPCEVVEDVGGGWGVEVAVECLHCETDVHRSRWKEMRQESLRAAEVEANA